MQANSVVYLVLVLVLAVATPGLGASASKHPEGIMSTITAECGPLMKFNDCWYFMDTFKWPLTSFSAEGPVTFLTKPEAELMVSSTSFVIFNANYTANWTVDITYAEAPNKPGFRLEAGYEQAAGFEHDYITATIVPRHYALITPPSGAVRLPCPGSPASAQCTMLYLPIVLRYNGSWNATSTSTSSSSSSD